jgi:Holliday junction resolvase
MGLKSRNKGQRNERQLVNLLKDAGLDATRVPLSGMGHSSGGEFSGDIVVRLASGQLLRFEAKIRQNGFVQTYQWLGNHDALIIRADRREALVVVRLDHYAELLRAADDEGEEETRNQG